MTIDLTLSWQDLCDSTGSCIRPGGTALTERALRVCNLASGSFVVDIGCGAGGTLEYLARFGAYRSVGLDCSEKLLADAVSRLVSGRLIRGKGEILPFKNGSFNALFCECVLSILKDRTTALFEFARVLKEDGFLIMSDVFRSRGPGHGEQETTSGDGLADGPLTKEDLLKALRALGFSFLLWEEHQRLLKEFVARTILAGGCIPDSWRYGQRREGQKDRSGISYFLLVARKQIPALARQEHKEIAKI